MKKIIKKILSIIFNDKVLDILPLRFLNFLEEKDLFYAFIRFDIMQNYYKRKLKSISFNQDKNRNKNKGVYIVTNIFPLWKKSVSSHLKINMDVAKVYLDAGYEIHLVFTLHSHMSIFRRNGTLYSNYMKIKKQELIDKLYLDIYNMYGLSKSEGIYIHILNDSNGKVILNKYIKKVITFFNELNRNDIVLFSGGKLKSDLVEILLPKIKAKTIYYVTNTDIELNGNEADIILTNNEKTLKKACNAYKPIIPRIEPFKWEQEEKIDISFLEERLYNIDKIFISCKQKFSESIDDEFIEILNYIDKKFENKKIILIGDSFENIKKKLKDKINLDNIIVIEFIENLYGFYKELNKKFKCVYILPRISGSALCNLYAALNAIPTIIFKRSDNEGITIPSEYFVNNLDEYKKRLKTFIYDEIKRNKFIASFNKFKKLQEEKGKNFYLGFINE